MAHAVGDHARSLRCWASIPPVSYIPSSCLLLVYDCGHKWEDDFLKNGGYLFSYLLVCMHTFMQVPTEVRKEHQIPWSWNYKNLGGTWEGRNLSF